MGQQSVARDAALVEIEIPSRVDMVAVVRMVVSAANDAVEAVHGQRLDDLRWLTSEATTNAIEANLESAGIDTGNVEDVEIALRLVDASEVGRVLVTAEVVEGRVSLTVADQGPGIVNIPEGPDITDPDRLLVEGAFGIPLMRHLSNSMSFESTPEGTVVELELLQSS